MFERWTDVLAGAVAAIGLAYLLYEVDRRQRKLRDVFYVLEGEDQAIFDQLEEMVGSGLLKPDRRAAI
jgi:membrane-associated phospholipid phosphatase